MEDFDRNKQRRNGGKVHHEAYSPERLDSIKRLITNFEGQGRKKRYAILVDGELIVPTNSDSENFDTYLDYVEPHTEMVEVRTFYGDSPNCNRYMFHLKEMPTGLSGFGNTDKTTSQQVQEALEKQSLRTRIMILEEELKRKSKKLKKYRELQAETDDKQIDIKELLVKGIELYGHINNKNQLPSQQVQGLPPAEVEMEQEEISPSDSYYRQLKENYSEKQIMQALKLWELFIKNPDLREEFTKVITLKQQQNGKEHI